jgi:hypothetical protein
MAYGIAALDRHDRRPPAQVANAQRAILDFRRENPIVLETRTTPRVRPASARCKTAAVVERRCPAGAQINKNRQPTRTNCRWQDGIMRHWLRM